MVRDPCKCAYECIEFSGLNKNCQKFRRHLSTIRTINANEKQLRIPSWKNCLTRDNWIC
ncbi:hypothetical protein GWO43_06545 [candidate division KSB1 bacterium]|nr:hypothetical protein [candidate division KSB1 bacterium]NIS23619.1 hypothetical protein [candidate division KSB1 bacterium]NIT70545.1 hypothetical protein [candidate division KSB1 bacterium]NIU24252.1 hypothetical protein [candidate division KSB1 bacterium]NIU93821.1 hypothetical protein [candidate division KSB1 bacterium]